MGPTVGITLFASLIILKFLFRKSLAQKPHNIEDLLFHDGGSLSWISVLRKSLAVSAEVNGHSTFNQFIRVGFLFMIASVAVRCVVLLIDVLIRLNLGLS